MHLLIIYLSNVYLLNNFMCHIGLSSSEKNGQEEEKKTPGAKTFGIILFALFYLFSLLFQKIIHFHLLFYDLPMFPIEGTAVILVWANLVCSAQ